MANIAMSVQFPATPPITGHPPASAARQKPTPSGKTTLSLSRSKAVGIKKALCSVRAIEKSRESSSETSAEAEVESEPELTQLGGSEIKAATAEEEGLLGGVAAETKEIEWPAFGKVIGTTWVVLGVIAGSSVVLLTLNFFLAELSDRVFAGRGVQDFFS